MIKFIRETWLVLFLVFALTGPIFTFCVLCIAGILKILLSDFSNHHV